MTAARNLQATTAATEQAERLTEAQERLRLLKEETIEATARHQQEQQQQRAAMKALEARNLSLLEGQRQAADTLAVAQAALGQSQG